MVQDKGQNFSDHLRDMRRTARLVSHAWDSGIVRMFYIKKVKGRPTITVMRDQEIRPGFWIIGSFRKF